MPEGINIDGTFFALLIVTYLIGVAVGLGTRISRIPPGSAPLSVRLSTCYKDYSILRPFGWAVAGFGLLMLSAAIGILSGANEATTGVQAGWGLSMLISVFVSVVAIGRAGYATGYQLLELLRKSWEIV